MKEVNLTRVIAVGAMGGGVLTLGWTMYPPLLSLIMIGLLILGSNALKLEETEIKAHPDRKWE